MIADRVGGGAGRGQETILEVVRRSRIPREQRVVTRCQVTFERMGDKVVAESEDLSRHGVFVRTTEVLPAGAVVELEIRLPNQLRVELIARVAHLLSESAARALGRRPGMGFEFLDGDDKGRDRLLEYLEDLIEEVTPPPQGLPQQWRVLVADPNAPLLDRLSMALHGAGFHVEAFTNGVDAYASILETSPNAIVAAANMPGLDGWTLVRMLQVKANRAEVPVILMDDDGSDITRLQAYRLGAKEFLHKPFTDEELVLRLRRLSLEQKPADNKAALHGNLGPISIATLLSLLEFERKSGILVVLHDRLAARLFIADGRVVKVEGPTNEDAAEPMQRIMRVLDWSDGNFEFVACEVVGSNELNIETTRLLLEHARIRDEAKR